MRRKRSWVSSLQEASLDELLQKRGGGDIAGGELLPRAHSSKCCATVSRRPTGSGIWRPPLRSPSPSVFFSPLALRLLHQLSQPLRAPGRRAASANASSVADTSAGETHGSTRTQCCAMCAPHSVAALADGAPEARHEFGEVLIELAQALLRSDPRADETLGDVAVELAIILREDEPPRHLARHRARAFSAS